MPDKIERPIAATSFSAKAEERRKRKEEMDKLAQEDKDTTDTTVQEEPTPPPKNSQASADGESFLINPPKKKDAQRKTRPTYLPENLNDKVVKKLKIKGLSYNYVVNQLLERWVNRED